MPEIYMMFVRKIFSPTFFGGGECSYPSSVTPMDFVCYHLRPLFSLQTYICSGASEDTPGDAKCVTEILGRGGGKNKKVGGIKFKFVQLILGKII